MLVNKSVIVKVGEEEFAIQVDYVISIERMQPYRRFPGPEGLLKGMMQVRGEVIPIMSLANYFGERHDKEEQEQRIVVIEYHHKVIGVIVDEATDVVTIEPTNVQKIQEMETVKLGERMIILLDVPSIINKAILS
ncbi:chemotaxis protein CheW [Priestia koreensis]|uniref:CheW-like domain-containing protein n=1 Tax=Priestia koreensis TaxID=284581 RepID=A0A0M0LI73_9BACI|nr:chemotaxis protein CheW [Priestia koreensis]KOO50780.1 hypothetical protein AMD01_03315 [Priestia koreensis]